MPSLQLKNLSLFEFADAVLAANAGFSQPRSSAADDFQPITQSFGPGRIGLVGRNGCGKPTLLRRIAAAEHDPSIYVSAPARILRQSFRPDETIAEVFGVAEKLRILKQALRGDGDPSAWTRLDWTLDTKLEAALSQIGLGSVFPDTPMGQLSGGQQQRAALAACFFDGPDIILLDEPTNNMDADGRAELTRQLEAFTGIALIASHDTTLLEHVDQILSLDGGQATLFGGGWQEFAAARDAARERAASDLRQAKSARDQAARARAEAHSKKARHARSGKALRASRSHGKSLLDAQKERFEQSQSGQSRVLSAQEDAANTQLEAAQDAAERVTPTALNLPDIDVPPSRRILDVSELTFGYDRPLAAPLSFSVSGPERIHLKGRNGSGKSTLIKTLLGQMPPLSGQMSVHVPLAYLDQHAALLGEDGTLIDAFYRVHSRQNKNKARAALSAMGFRGADGEKSVSSLSGGEKLRAALAIAFASPQTPQGLILDEPTNHLDMQAREALTEALNAWSGALIVVTHDTHFSRQIGLTRTIALC